MALMKAEHLSLGYDGKIVAKDINFTIPSGSYLCIIGENGTGKSTLMKTILGLIPKLSGEIVFLDKLKRREIGYLPQQTQIQRDFPASVREIVLSGCHSQMGLRPFYGKREKYLAEAAMEKMGISQLARNCYRELSGGQQQRVLLARAFCATRKILFLDEPVTGLDPMAAGDMYRMLHQLNGEGITIVMISHDVEEAIQQATHILHIGKKNFFGTKENYLSSETGERFLQNGGSENE